MSKMTKRKYVFQEVEDCNVELAPNHEVVKVLGCRGNNLHEVATPKGEKFLVSMPTKFRRTVYVKRGDYVIIEYIKEGVRVKGEVSRILYKDHINQLHKDGSWPVEFENAIVLKEQNIDMFTRNPNHFVESENVSDGDAEKDENDCDSEEEDSCSSSGSDSDEDCSSSVECEK